MVDRLGGLVLSTERLAPVVVDFGVVGPDAHGLPEMLDRLGQLALLSERDSQGVLSGPRLGVEGKCMGPELLRVAPDLGLVPGETSQPE